MLRVDCVRTKLAALGADERMKRVPLSLRSETLLQLSDEVLPSNREQEKIKRKGVETRGHSQRARSSTSLLSSDRWNIDCKSRERTSRERDIKPALFSPTVLRSQKVKIQRGLPLGKKGNVSPSSCTFRRVYLASAFNELSYSFIRFPNLGSMPHPPHPECRRCCWCCCHGTQGQRVAVHCSTTT